jgi:general secretion pathway protein A
LNAAARAAVERARATGQESRDVYTDFFGLNEKPFAITPDPRYLYMSARHTDALAHLLYGISESGGFIQLTGEVGTGKTTLIRTLLEQLPEKADIALILSPQLTTLEFLQTIIDELHCPRPADRTVKAQVDALNAHLMEAHAAGRRVVLIVDEAQTLSPELLEQVRLLTNLETAKQKLLQIILIGQPELRDVLDRSEMRQIAQRITGRYHLEPLTKVDTQAYVNHRLRVAGAQRDIFTRGAVRALHRVSRGIPRLINVIADRALLAGYTRDRRTIDTALVRAAAAEVFGIRGSNNPWWPALTAVAGAVALLFGVSSLDWQRPEAPPAQPAPAAQAASAAFSSVASPPSALPGPEIVVAAEPQPPVPADEPAAPPPRAFSELLAEPGFAQSTDAAVGELLALWGGRYEAQRGEPCRQAEEQGLRCLYQSRGSLGELRRLNWPAVLSLVGEDGTEHSVVVTALDHDGAALVSGGKTFELPLAELGYRWYGNHLLLWRPGGAPGKDLAPGDDDEGVRWLRATLAQLAGEPAPSSTSTLYDAALEQRVRTYQRDRQLTVDGIVGARTQVAMLAELGLPDTPQLIAGH